MLHAICLCYNKKYLILQSKLKRMDERMNNAASLTKMKKDELVELCKQEIRPGSVFCTRIGLENCADIQRLQNAAFFSKMLSFLGRSIVLEVEGTVGSKTVDPPIQSERGYNVSKHKCTPSTTV